MSSRKERTSIAGTVCACIVVGVLTIGMLLAGYWLVNVSVERWDRADQIRNATYAP